MEMKDNIRKKHIELVRVLAICLVVFHHTDICYGVYHNSDNPVAYALSLFVTVLCNVDVPLFFIVSGYLLLNKEESIRDLFKKRVSRMLMVLIIFSVIMYVFWVLRGTIETPSVGDFLKRLYTGDIQGTYWFLYSYIGFLLISPFLRMIVSRIKLNEYFYFFIFMIVLEIVYMIGDGTGIKPSVDFRSIVRSVSEYSFFAISGGVFKKYEKELETMFKTKYVIWATAFSILTPMLIVSISLLSGNGYAEWGRSAFSTLLGLSLYFVIHKLVHANEKSKILGFLARGGKYVFAVYLIEQLMRSLYLIPYKHMIEILPATVVEIMYGSIAIVTGFCVAFVLKKIPGIKKLL